MNKKKIITNRVVSQISPYDFAVSIDSLIQRLTELKAKHGGHASFDWDAHFWYDYDPNPSPVYHLDVQREETDEEYEQRLAQEKAVREEQRRQDLAKLAELQAKYGPI